MISGFNLFRFVRSGALCVSLLLFVSGCGKTDFAEAIHQATPAGDEIFSGITDTTSAEDLFSDAPDHFIDSLLSSMSLEDKVGQMLFPAVQPGRQTKDEMESKHYKNYKPGGFVLFGSSITKTAKMIRELQDESEIPLLISEDFERGLAMRIPGSKSYPFNMALGAADAPLLVYEMGKRIATDSKIIGVHWNLAPVLDINNNSENPIINVRSFGEDTEQVANLGIMMMKGLQAGGILSSLKHFPGHGNSSVDSHSDLAVIKGSKEEFERNELYPFKKNIDRGAFSVMVGHLGIEAYNLQDTPATLSYRIVTELLRKELKFKGIINTDAMSMKAISKYHSPGEAAVLAVNAGVDVIMASLSTIESFNAILNEVRSGRMSEERINQSVRRIIQVKKWLGLFEKRYAPMSEVEKLMNEDQLDEIGKDLAIRSITLVKNDPKIFPLDKKTKYLHIVAKDGKDFPNEKIFIEEIEKRNKNIETWQLPQQPDATDLITFREKTEGYKTVIVSVYLQIRNSTGRINLDKNKVDLINSLVKKGKKVILLAHSHPYALKHFPEVDVFVTNYGAEYASEVALAASIFGEHNISGKLPVSVKGTIYKKGDGINLLKEKGKTSGNDKKFKIIDELVLKGISDSVFPAASIAIIKDGKIFYEQAYGRFTYDKDSDPVKLNSLFDLASLTKVTATTFAVMKLYEEGKINLDSPVEKYFPEFKEKSKVTIKHILTHSSGLPASKVYYKLELEGEEIIADICNQKLEYTPGSKTVYSDLGMIIMAKVVERISGRSFEEYLADHLWTPLGMTHTMFKPELLNRQFCVPTEIDDYIRHRLIQGTVHDENCELLGGVSGHAGLFSSAQDISKYLLMLLSGGMFEGQKILEPETIKKFCTRQSSKSSRALGWDTNLKFAGIAGKGFSEGSFGHTGFTGTSIWADLDKRFAIILFTNRVYPSRKKEGIREFRIRFHESVSSLLLSK